MAISLETRKPRPSLPRPIPTGEKKSLSFPWQSVIPYPPQETEVILPKVDISAKKESPLPSPAEQNTAATQDPAPQVEEEFQPSSKDEPTIAKKSKQPPKTLATREQHASNTLAINSNLKQTSPSIENKKTLAGREQDVSRSSPKTLATREQHASNTLAEEILMAGREQDVSNSSPKTLATREQHASNTLAGQKRDVSLNEVKEHLETLVGKEKQLLLLIFQKCQLVGGPDSPYLTTEELQQNLQVNANRLRNLIYRVAEKGLLHVPVANTARSGHRKFCIRQEVYQHLCIANQINIPLAGREQDVSNSSPKTLAYTLAEDSNNNNIDIKPITIIPQEEVELEEDWLLLDISPLGQIGFSWRHVKEIVDKTKNKKKNLTPQHLQESIYQFAFDLEKGHLTPDIKRNPLSSFIRIIIAGGTYNARGPYQDPYLENLKATEKRMAEKRAREQELEKKIEQHAFLNWKETLNEEEIHQIAPAYRTPGPARDAVLANHFNEVIWPGQKKELMQAVKG